MLSVAELARRTAQPTGIVSVTSRSFQKSCGNQNVSALVFVGMHSLRSRAVRSEILVGSSAPLAPVYATAYARLHVGQRTERERALKDAPSWIQAPPWYSARAETVIPLGRRSVSCWPRISVGCCGPKMWNPSAVQDERHTVSGAAMSFGLLMMTPRAAIAGKPGSTQPPPAANGTVGPSAVRPRSRTKLGLVYTLPPRSSHQLGWFTRVPSTDNSTPVFDMLPTSASCETGQPPDGICRTAYSASLVRRWYHVASRVNRLRNKAASKPNSASRVRSGPMSVSPTLPGSKPDWPLEVTAVQLRTASNAPGARPDHQRAPRSFTSPRFAGQNGSSEITYDPLTLGYACSPRARPKALFPSKRTPPVRK